MSKIQDAGSKKIELVLRAKGLRATASRIVVLKTLKAGEHLSVENICAEVNKTLPETSLQTIYGVLESLCKAGLARKLEPAGGGYAVFELEQHDNHHHMVCRLCGAIEDTPCQENLTPCLQPLKDTNFSVDLAEVTFYGTCARCQ